MLFRWLINLMAGLPSLLAFYLCGHQSRWAWYWEILIWPPLGLTYLFVLDRINRVWLLWCRRNQIGSTQWWIQDFRSVCTMNNKVKKLNNNIKTLRYYWKGFYNMAGETALAWQTLESATGSTFLLVYFNWKLLRAPTWIMWIHCTSAVAISRL